MVDIDDAGKMVTLGNAATQAPAVSSAIKVLVEAAGGTIADVAFNSIFLDDLGDYQTMNSLYREIFFNDFVGAILRARRSREVRVPCRDRIDRASDAREIVGLRAAAKWGVAPRVPLPADTWNRRHRPDLGLRVSSVTLI